MSYNNLEEYLVPASYFTQGGLWNWGYNGHGGLGNGAIGNNNGSPVQTISSGVNWKQTATGFYHNAGIKTDGTLWLWGDNRYYGQLGDNTTTKKSSPVQTVSGGTNWKLIACAFYHTTAIKTDGTLWLWGRNNYGQLGNNNTTSQSSPIQTVAAGNNWRTVSTGLSNIAGIKTDGTLWIWGRNAEGQLGTNNTTDRSSPVQTIASGTNWKQVSVGRLYCAAIKTDNTLWLWGSNQYGLLGDNTNNNKSSPIQTISSGNNWKQVSASDGNCAAIKTDGTLWIWGKNDAGQLGTNNTTYRSSPVQTIAGGTNWKLVSCGVAHIAAIKTDGTLWMWGSDAFGALGTNFSGATSSPVQTISAGTNWKSISTGYYLTAAINGTWGKVT
jgi:alpha-tubulin suppressor-like RCC1 family protein